MSKPPSGTPGEDSFLSRWSRRKLEEEEVVVEAASPAPTPAPASVDPDKTDAEILEELDLPDPDTLGPGDDFKAFMNSAVPTRLRNRALRKLWLSDPVLANLDELLDYGEDFTDAATVVENLQTAYQVGRGFVVPEEDTAEEVAEEVPDDARDEDPADADAPDPADPADSEPVAALEDAPEEMVEPPVALAPDPVSVADEPPLRPRRMRFRFEGG